jgi:Two component regulator propeller
LSVDSKDFMPRRLVATLAFAFVAASTFAVQPQFLRISTMRDFIDGDIVGLSVDSNGRLSLAPAAVTGPDLGASAIWSVVSDAQGTIFAGTGNNGKILKIEARTTQTFHTVAEPEVQALVFGPDGRLFAASNPEGRVYAIDKAGKSTVFFDPEERYIWALAFDAQGRLWVATGGEGKLYRVDAKGQGASILTSQDAHVTSLAVGPGGSMFAGSSPSGLVYSIDARENVRVLYDSTYREVKALLPMPNGSVYVALVDGRSEIPLPRPTPSPSPGPSPQQDTVTASTSIEVFAFPGTPSRGADSSRSGSGPARGAIFLVTALGDADQLWSGDESPFFLFKRNDAVLFGTGSKGRIYEVRDDRTYTIVRVMAQEQLTAAVPLPSGDMAIASSNPGKLQYLGAKLETRGVFTSSTRDFDNVAQVGALESSTASPAVAYEIRTGNSSVPDTTWSGWESLNAGKPPSRASQARFAQIRVTLSDSATKPTLSWLQLAYVQRNIRPVIREMTLYPAGEAFHRGSASGSGEPEIAGLQSGAPEIKPPAAPGGRSTDSANLGRKVFFKSLRTLSWRAEDANGDTLRYDVFYRPESSTSFTRLREAAEEPVFAWDTATVPSGRYLLRVTARDQVSNPEGRGLSFERDSEVFDVDNDPPVINASVASGLVKVTVTDTISAVRKAEWAREAGTWTDMTPIDGVADSREETFEFRLDGSPSAIVIRATDAFGNVALTRVPVARR